MLAISIFSYRKLVLATPSYPLNKLTTQKLKIIEAQISRQLQTNKHLSVSFQILHEELSLSFVSHVLLASLETSLALCLMNFM